MSIVKDVVQEYVRIQKLTSGDASCMLFILFVFGFGCCLQWTCMYMHACSHAMRNCRSDGVGNGQKSVIHIVRCSLVLCLSQLQNEIANCYPLFAIYTGAYNTFCEGAVNSLGSLAPSVLSHLVSYKPTQATIWFLYSCLLSV